MSNFIATKLKVDFELILKSAAKMHYFKIIQELISIEILYFTIKQCFN